MRSVYVLVAWITGVLASTSALAVPNPAGPNDAKLPKLQYLKSDTMAVGFDAPVADRGGEQPIEVQLHVSEDHGKNWKNTMAVAPSAKKFIFKAPNDGEFWFMSRTKYPGNKLLPNTPPGPMSRAVVDTVPPTLDLFAERGEGGELHVRWSATDANLDPMSLTIDYQSGSADTAWQKVALDTPPAGTKGDYRGEIDLVPQSAAGRITLRATVLDLAKNTMTTERFVSPPEETADRRGQRTTRATVTQWEPVPSERLPGQESDDDQAPPDGPPSDMSAQFPNDVPEAEPIGPGKPTGDRRHPFTSAQGEPDAEEIPTPRSDGHRTVAGQVRPLTGQPYLQRPVDDDDQGEAFPGELLPPGVRPHFVNKREFEMVYDVEEVGSSGVARVELWATRDGGRHWESFGEDDDCQSPMLVAVDDEGTYGFRVIIENGAGRRGLVPKPGDLPDVWVGVDLTKPRAKLISAEQGAGEEAGDLMITWDAVDERLAARPIALSFSGSPAGPWTTIASGLKNTGSYLWRLDRRVAEQIYLRLEVRDEAGNVTTIEPPDPITIDRARPQGRIRDIRAREEAGRRPRTVHNLTR